jgi:signal transduction histidine kinase
VTRSLRTRLFLVLLLPFVGAWLIAMIVLGTAFMRERIGDWEDDLVAIAVEVMSAMPADLPALSAGPRLTPLPVDRTGVNDVDDIEFQVWVKDRREAIVLSSRSTGEPLKPDFVDGRQTRTIRGVEWRVYALTDTTGRVQVQVGKSLDLILAEVRRKVSRALAVSIVVLLLLALAMKAVIDWSLKPMVRVNAAMAARSATDLEPLPGGDLPSEVGPLVDSFNRLLARVDRAVRRERQFFSEAAHELRTPLAVLLTQAQVALGARTLAEARGSLRQLVRGVERSARLSQQLLDSARLDVEHRGGAQAPLDLAAIVAMVVDDYGAMVAQKHQAITLDAERCPIVGNIDEMGVLVANLVDNAVRYTGRGGRIAVRCLREGAVVQLQVLDDGPGVADGDRERIFDRFFRVLGSNERGSGIGLSLVARIAQSHRATIATGRGLDGRGFGVTVAFALAAGEPDKVSDTGILAAT